MSRKRLSHAARRLDRNPSTVWRYIHRGVLIRGERVFLDAQRIGGEWFTTDEAIAKFLDTINPPSHGQAEQELCDDGFG